jgi:hypothetical protein
VRALLFVLLAFVALVVGVAFGWRYVVAPLLLYAVLRWAIASLRVLSGDAKALAGRIETEPADPRERTFFHCEECDTEVLLLVRGSTRAPSHCGQRMHERTELLGEVD